MSLSAKTGRRAAPSLGTTLLSCMLAIAASALPASALAQSAPAPDACAQHASAPPPAQPVRIRYGTTGGGEEPLALLWADKERYPNHGRHYVLEPKLYAANDRITAVQAGQLEAGSISLTALISAVRVGIDLRAVASVVETNDTDNQGAFVALEGSGLKSVADLKGKRIGYYGPNTISEYWIKSALRRAGMKPDDVQYVSMPPPAQEQALRNRQIDVAWLTRQFLSRAGKAGGVQVLLRPIQATGQAHPSTVVFFTQKFVQANPQAYCAWRSDYERALEDWRQDRDSRYPKLIAARYLTPDAAQAGPDGGRAPGGRINLRDVQQTIGDMVETGFLPMAKGMQAEGLVLKGYALQR